MKTAPSKAEIQIRLLDEERTSAKKGSASLIATGIKIQEDQSVARYSYHL